MTNVPITYGSGQASIAGDTVGVTTYQQIKVVDGTVGGSTPLIVNSDGTLNARISGSVLSAGSTFNGSVSGTVGASILGIVPVQLSNSSVIAVIQGSVAVAGTVTALASGNQSVSGTVGASIIGTVPVTQGGPINASVSGTVGASIIGTVPVNIVAGGSTGSVAANIQGSIATVIIGGSIAASFTPPANQSVSGTVQTDVRSSVAVVIIGGSIAASFTPPANQSVSGTVTANQGTNPWIVTGSVQGSFSPSGNQSVSGTVGASVIGQVPVFIIGGSIAASFTPPANQSVSGAVSISNFPTTQNVSGSVVATQGTNPWIITGSVQGTFAGTANQSVSGTVGSSIIGTVPVTQVTNPWTVVSSLAGGIFPVSGSVAATITNFPTTQNVSGSVVATQGTTPWVVNFQNSSLVAYQLAGSILATSATFTPPANQSVSGTVGASVLGTVPVTQGGTWIASVFGNVSVLGTVPVTQTTSPWIITGSVQGTFTSAANQSVSGTIGASIIGQLPAGNAILGAVAASISGTVTTIPQISSIIAINAGSVVAISQGSVITVLQAPSIVGTYAEDAASANTDKGIFTLNVRNDTLSSMTSADGDYTQMTVGPTGEAIMANAPFTKWVSGTADFRNGNAGASIIAISSGGSSVFTYITGVQIANMGSASVLVALVSGGSTLGYSIAPAGGGSNIYYQNGLKTPANFGFAASISGVASVLVSAQGFISKT